MAQINPQELAFRQMLTKLGSLITEEEFAAMRYMSKTAGIGDKVRDKLKSSLDLWEKLEERRHLGQHNLIFLKELMTSCTNNRVDVLEVIKKYEQDFPPNSAAGLNDLKKEITFLVENLGRDWKFFMRALGLPEPKLEMCVDSHPRNVREQMYMAFKEWQNDCTPNKNDILNALREINRNDLYNKLVSSS